MDTNTTGFTFNLGGLTNPPLLGSADQMQLAHTLTQSERSDLKALLVAHRERFQSIADRVGEIVRRGLDEGRDALPIIKLMPGEYEDRLRDSTLTYPIGGPYSQSWVDRNRYTVPKDTDSERFCRELADAVRSLALRPTVRNLFQEGDAPSPFYEPGRDIWIVLIPLEST